MNLFYSHTIGDQEILFPEEESRHLLQVLRHQPGDEVMVTDGKGTLYQAVLLPSGKKGPARAQILDATYHPPVFAARLTIALAPPKNIQRLEWFLEKATELGISRFRFLETERGERDRLRQDRLEKILVSAMKQSRQLYLPELDEELIAFPELLRQSDAEDRFVAACLDTTAKHLFQLCTPGKDTLVCIGPEGDFTRQEVALALQAGFQAVSLGPTILRTETAALMAAHTLALKNCVSSTSNL